MVRTARPRFRAPVKNALASAKATPNNTLTYTDGLPAWMGQAEGGGKRL